MPFINQMNYTQTLFQHQCKPTIISNSKVSFVDLIGKNEAFFKDKS